MILEQRDMTQVESISQSVELNQEEAVQLENFLNLLVELKIIEPPEQVSLILPVENNSVVGSPDCQLKQASPISPVEIDQNQDFPTGEIELLRSPVQFQVSEAPEYMEVSDIEPSKIPLVKGGWGDQTKSLKYCAAPNESSQSDRTLRADQNLEKPNPDNSKDAFQKLQKLLVGHELAELHDRMASIQQNLTKLEHQIYEPQELINLLLPWITELLKQKITNSKEEIVQAITPIVDLAIKSRVEQDKTSMGLALADAIPQAISQQIHTDPEEVAEALAPTMGRAFKKQIEIAEDTVVDALYPIIGSTITKYMAETIRAINQQIEDTLSVEGIKRKIRAKLQGVSEAELILKAAQPFTVQAIFLIHKTSGLVICDIQADDAHRLESEMVAGMLTAIRSFGNDCITTAGSVSELDAIDYGTSKIILEVAGYCYLAIVVAGTPHGAFIGKMRRTLGKLVKNYSELIEQFDGDPATIPSQVYTLLQDLKDDDVQGKKRKNQPSPLLLLSLTVFSAILIPWGIWQYQSRVIRDVENKTALALASTPELAVYRLNVNSDGGTLKLTGRVPNQILRSQAERIAAANAQKWLIDNQILSVEVPADPVLAAAEVKRVVKVLNQMDGTAISAHYLAGKVSVKGIISRIADAQTIQNAFEQIPGVKSVSSAVRVQSLWIERFYFEPNLATLTRADLALKLGEVKFFLDRHPMKHLKIVGYSYDRRSKIAAQQLALERAKTVQQALINQGIDPSRLHIIRTTNFPPGIDANQPSWLSRCVVLELIDKQF